MDSKSILLAIAREEGWAEAASRCRRNNNPGNIEFGPFAMTYGSVKGDPRFAIFDTPLDGFKCLQALLNDPVYKGKTIAEMVAIYAPSNENNVLNYVKNICYWTGHTADTVIDDYIYLPSLAVY